MTWVDWLVLVLLGLPTLVWLTTLVTNAITFRTLQPLAFVQPDPKHLKPSPYEACLLSIVVPACNEAHNIEATLDSLLSQKLPLEIVVVNDRSTDETGEIIDAFAARDRRVKAIHIEELPEGWLGKLNALHQGVQCCEGRWLVFADADVVFKPEAIARCITYAEQKQLNLVTALPQILSAGFWGDLALNATGSLMTLGGRFWKVPDPDSSAVAGFGTFILIRHEAFRQTPGFPWLRLEVADDMALGLMVKTYAGRCEAVCATEHMKIRWYESYDELMRKTQKNFFGIVGRFSALRIWAFALGFLWVSWFPLALLLPYTQDWLLWLGLGGAGVTLVSTLWVGAWMKRPWLPSIFYPVGWLLGAWIMLRAGWLGWRLGGIQWRGVLYPSSLLRDQQRLKL
ncbi:MAG: glycosyltransferase [Deltaproteobacteria bacterium]|nr:MAG: glycosyltransferase [Deltaproteobacteria bacterium]